MFDLNGFKLVNDRLGHHAGDKVLVEVASRMKTVCTSASSIARIGGDEFALLFGADIGLERAKEEAEAIRSMIMLPFNVADTNVSISTSIGLAHSVDGARSVSSLLQSADTALYANKAKNCAATRQGQLAMA